MKSFNQYITESVGYLYHATYKAYKSNIKSGGLKINPKHRNWTDSKKGTIYLAINPDIALSYAETSETVSDKVYNSGIVVYKVNKKHLDLNKLKKDKNVIGDGGTLEYYLDIPSKHLKIHSEHDT